MPYKITPSMEAGMNAYFQPTKTRTKKKKSATPTESEKRKRLKNKFDKLSKQYWNIREKEEVRRSFNNASDRPHYTNILKEQEAIYREMRKIQNQLKRIK